MAAYTCVAVAVFLSKKDNLFRCPHCIICFILCCDHRACLFYLIVTAAEPQRRAADDALADFRRFLRCLPGTKEAAVILGTGTWDKDGVYRHPATPEAYEMERSL